MKKSISVVVLTMLFAISVFSQNLKQKTIVKAVPLIQESTYKLNGSARGSMGGTSRKVFSISLPLNTIEWYYSVTSSSDGSTTNDKINLAVQLATAVATATTGIGKAAAFTGLDQAVVSALKLPSGTMPINTYVLSAAEAQNFLNKKGFNYLKANEDLLQGITKINYPLMGTWQIAIQNPSTFSGITFKIEVVALTRESRWVVD